MAKNKTVGIIAGVFLGALSLAGIAAAQRVYVRVGPPPVVVERRPVRPGPLYVWEPGYQNWNGSAYVWAPGSWALPPRRGGVWIAGRWVHGRRGWYWVGGHWR
jgi:hypothetical protein